MYNKYMDTTAKKCDLCKEVKRQSEFNKNKTKKDGFNSICRDCSRAKSKEYYKHNKKEHIKKVSAYKRANKAQYIAYSLGVDKNEVQLVLNSSDGKCRICKRKKTLVVDHCHDSNKVRGLLCSGCNKGLGFFQDNIKYLQSAIQYLT